MENNEQTIHAEQSFQKGVNDLYDAWVNPDKLKQWWHPAQNKLVNVENNLADGGNIKYEFQSGKGEQTILITGNYKEVKPAQKLVYSWNWQVPDTENLKDNHFELTVEFSGDNSRSNISITQKNMDAAETIHPHEKGWKEELESLQQFLS